MLPSRNWRVVAILLTAICLPMTLCGVILKEREYHGKKVMCAYSGLIGVAKSCGTQSHTRVFTGTVKSAIEFGDTDKRLDILPDESFVGDSKELTAITHQACLDHEIRAGDRWLFYLDRDPKTNEWVLSYDGPSKPLSIATDEVSMLRELANLKDEGILTGHVDLLTGEDKVTPLTNREIIARNVKSRKRYTARLSQNGYFAFKLPAGSYRIVVAPESAFREVESFGSMQGNVPVEKGACWQHDFAVKQLKNVQP